MGKVGFLVNFDFFMNGYGILNNLDVICDHRRAKLRRKETSMCEGDFLSVLKWMLCKRTADLHLMVYKKKLQKKRS